MDSLTNQFLNICLTLTQNKIMKQIFYISSLLFLTLIVSCSKSIDRIDPNSTIDLSGKWNDVDSRLVAKSMIKNCLESKWLSRYDKTPTLIVGKIVNKSHEHINTTTFIKDIEREFVLSGDIDLVANKSERTQLREEIADQEVNASQNSRKSLGKEYGADVILIGTISTLVDKEGKKQVKFYQINLELLELQSNRKRWIGSKKIKKFIKDRKFIF